MADEELCAKQTRDNPELEDIHVPGLGVRAALADDDAEKPRIWSRAREKYSRRSEFVGRWTSQTLKDARFAGARQLVKLTKIAHQYKGGVRAYHRRAVDMASLADHRLRKMHVLLLSVVYIAAFKLRGRIVVEQGRARSIAKILRERRAEFLRVTRITCAQVNRAIRESWPLALRETGRYSRRAQSFLASTTPVVRGRVRAQAGRVVKFWLSRSVQFNLVTVRRALPALAALLVIATFVLQVAVAASRR